MELYFIVLSVSFNLTIFATAIFIAPSYVIIIFLAERQAVCKGNEENNFLLFSTCIVFAFFCVIL